MINKNKISEIVKVKTLIPNKHGNFPCPYCSYILTAIVKVYIPLINEYICHHCQIKFEILLKGGIEKFEREIY